MNKHLAAKAQINKDAETEILKIYTPVGGGKYQLKDGTGDTFPYYMLKEEYLISRLSLPPKDIKELREEQLNEIEYLLHKVVNFLNGTDKDISSLYMRFVYASELLSDLKPVEVNTELPKMKIDKHKIDLHDGWLYTAELIGIKGMVVSADTKQKAFEELLTSIKVQLMHEFGETFPPKESNNEAVDPKVTLLNDVYKQLQNEHLSEFMEPLMERLELYKLKTK